MRSYGQSSEVAIDFLSPGVSLRHVTAEVSPLQGEAPASSIPQGARDLMALATLLVDFSAGIPEHAVTPARRLAATLCGDWSNGNRIASRAIAQVVREAMINPESSPKTALPRVLFVSRVLKLVAGSEHPNFDVGADVFAFSTRVTVDERIDAIKALNGMDSDRQRLVLYMGFVLGMTDVEIAQSLDTSRSAVRKLSSRGMRALRASGLLGDSDASFQETRPLLEES